MKTVDLTDRTGPVGELLRQAQDDDLMLRTADGGRFLLLSIDDFDEEIALTRKNEALMALLDERAAEPGTIDFDEAMRRLGLDDD